ncbi:MAG: serine hydrolase, partial [Myxococcaceae bacterium]|nr:serine hydrolase [Myxococcaceae bacterium]
VRAAMECAPDAPVGTRAVYSDVGFILLGEALAAAHGGPLDAVFSERVRAPLGLMARFRRMSEWAESGAAAHNPLTLSLSRGERGEAGERGRWAATGLSRPREPAPGQEGLWSLSEQPSVPGEVDDDNAWAMDGVAGHAGLFSTAADVARFGQAVLEELEGAGRLAPADAWRRALTRDISISGSTRAMGFDTPSTEGSSSGRFLSTRAVGHVGFTGTSLWLDPERALVVALLTNRTLPGRRNLGIRAFRPRFHDCVASLLP